MKIFTSNNDIRNTALTFLIKKNQEKLKNNYVILDRLERQELIWNNLCKEAKEHSLTIKEDTKLLEEVTGLVEFPVVMLGKMKDEFLKLPDEVLIASMRTHQKYFSVFDIRGNFAPYFLYLFDFLCLFDLHYHLHLLDIHFERLSWLKT